MGAEYAGRPTERCWCGNNGLVEFSEDYLRCPACETLVLARMPDPAQLISATDESGFYGRNYYENYLVGQLGLPSLTERARTDLPERCLYWLQTLLRYRLPPGRVLELGSAHGGFVALMRWAGFDAVGLEVSPWLVEFARRTFDVPMLLGPVEQQDLELRSFDVIAAMDLIEHLPDPVGTLRRCAELLKPTGMLLIQTPCFPAGKTHGDLQAENAPFLRMLLPPNHLFLFSRASLRRLLESTGLGYIRFERALFPYDMFAVAGKQPLATYAPEHVAKRLENDPPARLVGALLDLKERYDDLVRRHAESEADRTARRAGQTAPLQERGDPSQGRACETAGERRLAGWMSRVSRLVNLRKRQHDGRQIQGKSELRKIVIDMTAVLPGGQNGGAKIMTVELIKNLAALAKRCQFVLLTSHLSHEELGALDGPNVGRCCLRVPQDGQATSGLSERAQIAGALNPSGKASTESLYPVPVMSGQWGNGLIRTLEADLLFCPFTAPTFYHPSVPMVAVVHDLQHVDHPEFFEHEERIARDQALRQACRLASRLICISDFVRDGVLREGLGQPGRVRTVHIKLARRLSCPHSQALNAVLSQYGLVRDQYLLYPANFWPHKNHETLLRAFALYSEHRSDRELRLVLTGSPSPRTEEVRRMAAELRLADRVVVAGFLPDEEFAALLHGCLALVFPSLYEGWGMPVLEAMAAGKPVIASNLTSIREAAGNAAVLCDPRNPAEIAAAIDRLVHDVAWRLALAKQGASHAARYHDPEKMAADYLEIFREAIGNPPSPPSAVYGVHGDGWVGNRFVVLFDAGPPGRRLAITVWAPPWSSELGTTLFLPGDRGQGQSLHHIPCGETATIERLLPEEPGCWEIIAYPVYQLDRLGLSPDPRPLSCRVLAAEIRSPRALYLPLELFSYGM